MIWRRGIAICLVRRWKTSTTERRVGAFPAVKARQKASTAAKIIGAFPPLDSRHSRNKVHFHGITISGNWHLRWWMRGLPLSYFRTSTPGELREDGKRTRNEERETRNEERETRNEGEGEQRQEQRKHGPRGMRRIVANAMFYTSVAYTLSFFCLTDGGPPPRITKPSHRQLANDSPSCPPCQDSTTRARRARRRFNVRFHGTSGSRFVSFVRASNCEIAVCTATAVARPCRGCRVMGEYP